MRLKYSADEAMFVDMDKPVDADGNDGGDLGEELTTMEVVEGYNDLRDLARRLAQQLHEENEMAKEATELSNAITDALLAEARAAGLLAEGDGDE